MKETKYKAREYRSEAIINKASDDIKILAESLLPRGYKIRIKNCDVQSENEFTRRYKYVAKVIPDHDCTHFAVYSRTENGAYAKVVELLFERPIYPIL